MTPLHIPWTHLYVRWFHSPAVRGNLLNSAQDLLEVGVRGEPLPGHHPPKVWLPADAYVLVKQWARPRDLLVIPAHPVKVWSLITQKQ